MKGEEREVVIMALLADGPLCDDLYRSNKMGYGRDFSSVPDPDPDPDSDL
jgi:hypothetical protein